MTVMIVHHRVKEYRHWREVFDSLLDFRRQNGELSAKVYRAPDDPKHLTLLCNWDSLENARKFAISEELGEAMQKAGVDGIPTFHFLNEA